MEVSAARPDAFRPDLARSLHNLSNRLADLGRPQGALDAGEEAVTIRRELAARWPDAYRQQLEQSLRVVAWLQHSESNASSTHPRESPGRDNGPLSRPPVIVFHAAQQNASRLSPAHLGEAGTPSGRNAGDAAGGVVHCVRAGRPRPRTGSRR